MIENVSEPYSSPTSLVESSFYQDFRSADNIRFVQDLLNASPLISAIVNHRRQIVLSNRQFNEMAETDDLTKMIGRFPGELIECIHHSDNIQCGTSESCKVCGLVQTIKKSQTQATIVTNECRITTGKNSLLKFYNFEVTCSPVYFNGQMYTLLSMADISSRKRNEMLENVFLHDFLNRLGGLNGIIHAIRSENKQPEIAEYIDILHALGEMIIEDIQTQRYLKAAENDNLILNLHEHSAFEIMESAKKQFSFHPAARSNNIVIEAECSDFKITTDSTLLKRILLNMLKNAAEATPEHGMIRLICSKNKKSCSFSVNNPGTIPDEVGLQIFQRSFSTKGNGSGLGTYSMKLFGENYLRGKVYFTSDEKRGTTFTVELPLL
jgi:K+-sensing histidine kinase KdpD